MDYDIKDIGLATTGQLRIEWASKSMPVLNSIKERFSKDKPLSGLRISACLHITTETAVLARTLKAGGASVALCASNPLSTQDDVAASLVAVDKIPVFAIKGEDTDTYYSHILSPLKNMPNLTMDDGADLVSSLHFIALDKWDDVSQGIREWGLSLTQGERNALIAGVMGGTEETTTGVIRLRSMERDNVLQFPVISVNDANTKHLFDNRYGTGQSTIDGIIRATNRLLAGSHFVVCGYGWCGRGVAARAKGHGAKVIICEVDPLKALEAVMDGFDVMPIAKAAKIGDFFCTLTGDINAISKEHFLDMRDGAIISNSGHFNVELDLPGLAEVSTSRRKIREFVEEYTLQNGNRVYLLGEGRLINLAAAEGHPSSVMDMSFANQALSMEYLSKEHKNLDKRVYPVPLIIDQEIARLKLVSMGVEIDSLTPEQEKYLSSWEMGT
ncbi:MAG: adenosylhomocysteinase [Deltaproteobacteria bacterium]|nr:MAG: adenosylhomocysteinase [Deltaproteobacteria bacterium]